MEAKDVMTTPVVTVGLQASVEEVAELMLKQRISGVPVVDGKNRLQGIVSEGDLIRRLEPGSQSHRSWWLDLLAGRDATAFEYVKAQGRTAADVMTRKVVTVGERTSLANVAALLEHHHIKRAPVVQAGRVVGIVSRANLLHGLAALKAARSGTAPTDRKIRLEVLKELDRAAVDRSLLNVVVAGGAVEFWGFVETETQKRALAVAARSVKGTKTVADHTTVPSPMVRAFMGSV